MNFKRYLLHVSTAMTAIFGGTFLIRYFKNGDILIDQLVLAVIGLVLLLISLQLRKKETSQQSDQTQNYSDSFTADRLDSYKSEGDYRKKPRKKDD